VAYFYQNGIEVEKNLQKAIDFYQEAAYNKHEKSKQMHPVKIIFCPFCESKTKKRL
jgi:TPR repeat protein